MRWPAVLLGCAAVAGCAAPSAAPATTSLASSEVSPVRSPVAPPVAAAPSGLPSLDPDSTTIVLPPDFTAAGSSVSPDGRFVAARAKDYSRVVLYRVRWPSPRSVQLRLDEVAEVPGYADQIAWLEDSSALLVGTDLDGRAVGQHDPTRARRRVAILNTDGAVVIAPEKAHSILSPRAHASPDGRWIWVADRCCAQQALLLSRDGGEVRTVVPPQPSGRVLGFAGWSGDGSLLCWEQDAQGSQLVAVSVDGTERYRIAAPAGLSHAGWGVVLSAPDRSWQLVELSGGIGSSEHGYRLLVGRDLRPVPDALTRSYARFGFGSEILYVDRDTGVVRAYEPLRGAVRALAVRLDLSAGVTPIGVVDGFFVWMKLIYGYVTDLASGRTVALPLSSPPATSVVAGGRLAEYRHGSEIVLYDLRAVTR